MREEAHVEIVEYIVRHVITTEAVIDVDTNGYDGVTRFAMIVVNEIIADIRTGRRPIETRTDG